jgi:glyoxylase-like metal-dependent hydrolase (beta-lactamase superfamily II)
VKIITIITQVHNTDNIIIRDVPVSSTIIELSDNYLAIIDTGMADNLELLIELGQWGYCPADFDLVINTHLHCDHVGGNRLFEKARIFISQREYEYEKDFGQALRESNDSVNILSSLGRKVDATTSMLAGDLKKLAEAYPVSSLVGRSEQIEFFEELPLLPNGMSLVPTPGHSIASHAVLIEGNCGRALVDGDAFYHRDLWQEASVPGINYNEEMFRKTARKISKFRGIIIPGHDRAFDNLNRQYLENDSFLV